MFILQYHKPTYIKFRRLNESKSTLRYYVSHDTFEAIITSYLCHCFQSQLFSCYMDHFIQHNAAIFLSFKMILLLSSSLILRHYYLTLEGHTCMEGVALFFVFIYGIEHHKICTYVTKSLIRKSGHLPQGKAST